MKELSSFDPTTSDSIENVTTRVKFPGLELSIEVNIVEHMFAWKSVHTLEDVNYIYDGFSRTMFDVVSKILTVFGYFWTLSTYFWPSI